MDRIGRIEGCAGDLHAVERTSSILSILSILFAPVVGRWSLVVRRSSSSALALDAGGELDL
jgi:hypothetical protein